VPVLLSAGASLAGLDRLFDDGWLADAGPNRARFLQPGQVQEVVAAIPWSRRRKWHSELARASEALRRPASDVAHHHLEAHEFEAARPMLLRAVANGGTQRRPQMPSCATGKPIPPIRRSRAQYVLNWPFSGRTTQRGAASRSKYGRT
jgi:hypothetical protein